MSAPEKPIDISLDALGEAKKRAGIDGASTSPLAPLWVSPDRAS